MNEHVEQQQQRPREWTSDFLLRPGGMTLYCDQVRVSFRAFRTEFRSLAAEVQGDLVADPMPEDSAWQARMHAWQVARVLREMERSAQRIVMLAKKLEATHQRNYVDLPKSRAARRERDARRQEIAAARPARTALPQQSAARPEEEPVVFDLFPEARR